MSTLTPYLPLIALLITVFGWVWMAGAYSQRVRDLETAVAEIKADQNGLRKEVLDHIKALITRVDSLFTLIGSKH